MHRASTGGTGCAGPFCARPIPFEAGGGRSLPPAAILYVQLEPGDSRVGERLGRYRWSGHGEVLRGGRSRGLVTWTRPWRPSSRRGGRRCALPARDRGSRGGGVAGRGPGRLPWWRLGRPSRKDEDELDLDRERPRRDGRSEHGGPAATSQARRAAAVRGEASGIDARRSSEQSAIAAVVEAREVVAWVAVVHYGFAGEGRGAGAREVRRDGESAGESSGDEEGGGREVRSDGEGGRRSRY